MSLLLCLLVLASEADAPDSYALQAGEPAPFAGVLLSEDQLLRLVQSKIAETELRTRLRILQAESDTLEELYQERMRQSQRPWYDRPDLRFVAGFASGAAAVVVTTWVVVRFTDPR